MLKRYGLIAIYILAVVYLLTASSCSPKPAELPKQYMPPALSEDDLEIEEALELLEDLVEETDTSEPIEPEENE